MTINELINEIKSTDVEGEYTPYEVLASVLRAINDDASRLRDVISTPRIQSNK